jgi:hypothetical protein
MYNDKKNLDLFFWVYGYLTHWQTIFFKHYIQTYYKNQKEKPE